MHAEFSRAFFIFHSPVATVTIGQLQTLIDPARFDARKANHLLPCDALMTSLY